MLSSTEFAESAGVCERVARRVFASGSWRGHHLPVVVLPGASGPAGRGGAGGTVWGLALDKASPELRALLKVPETLPSMPVERRLKGRPDDRHIAGAVDKQRIIAPIMAHPKGSHDRGGGRGSSAATASDRVGMVALQASAVSAFIQSIFDRGFVAGYGEAVH